jgi:hypothetical protein
VGGAGDVLPVLQPVHSARALPGTALRWLRLRLMRPVQPPGAVPSRGLPLTGDRPRQPDRSPRKGLELQTAGRPRPPTPRRPASRTARQEKAQSAAPTGHVELIMVFQRSWRLFGIQEKIMSFFRTMDRRGFQDLLLQSIANGCGVLGGREAEEVWVNCSSQSRSCPGSNRPGAGQGPSTCPRGASPGRPAPARCRRRRGGTRCGRRACPPRWGQRGRRAVARTPDSARHCA